MSFVLETEGAKVQYFLQCLLNIIRIVKYIGLKVCGCLLDNE